MRSPFHIATLFTLVTTLPLGGCDQPAAAATPTSPSSAITSAADRANASPQERAVVAAMEHYKPCRARSA